MKPKTIRILDDRSPKQLNLLVKSVLISFLILLYSVFRMSGQNVIHYNYDSAGNRTVRDTASVNLSLVPTTVIDCEQEFVSARQSPEAHVRDATANSNPGFSNDSLPKFVLPFDYFYTPAYRANDAFSGPLVSEYK